MFFPGKAFWENPGGPKGPTTRVWDPKGIQGKPHWGVFPGNPRIQYPLVPLPLEELNPLPKGSFRGHQVFPRELGRTGFRKVSTLFPPKLLAHPGVNRAVRFPRWSTAFDPANVMNRGRGTEQGRRPGREIEVEIGGGAAPTWRVPSPLSPRIRWGGGRSYPLHRPPSSSPG